VVRGMLKFLVAISFVAGSGAACGSSPPEAAPIATFCASADSVLNKGRFASAGGGVIESLRRICGQDMTSFYAVP